MSYVKTSELIGPALDWAVCMALGMKPEDIYISKLGRYVSLFRRLRDEDGKLNSSYMTGPDLLFSRKWEAGGPIIEREHIRLDPRESEWQAQDWADFKTSYGPTPLVAAMRCFVASKLGDEVEIPDCLLTTS